MAQYAISFDLDRVAMVNDGYTDAQINNNVYSKEVRDALGACGFTEHPEGSVYHTPPMGDEDSLIPIIQLQTTLRAQAPTFCRYVRSIHLFKMEGWSNITPHIQTTEETAGNIIQPSGQSASV